MRSLKVLSFLCLICTMLITACVNDDAPGGTISSQVTGTFISSTATVVVDSETMLDAVEDYSLSITEVDANTVSVITDHTRAFEVDLEKSENGEWTTGTTSSAGAGFTFKYHVSDGEMTIEYANENVALSFVGMKE